jgi:hypothetical protein
MVDPRPRQEPEDPDLVRLKVSNKMRAERPDAPAFYTYPVVVAVHALSRGEASPHQQTEVLKWIIEFVAGVNEHQFYPDDRQTAFSLGRKFVGDQIIKVTKMDLSKLRSKENG